MIFDYYFFSNKHLKKINYVICFEKCLEGLTGVQENKVCDNFQKKHEFFALILLK